MADGHIKPPNKIRAWAADEFEILTEREYQLLKRYHKETCANKICEV